MPRVQAMGVWNSRARVSPTLGRPSIGLGRAPHCAAAYTHAPAHVASTRVDPSNSRIYSSARLTTVTGTLDVCKTACETEPRSAPRRAPRPLAPRKMAWQWVRSAVLCRSRVRSQAREHRREHVIAHESMVPKSDSGVHTHDCSQEPCSRTVPLLERIGQVEILRRPGGKGSDQRHQHDLPSCIGQRQPEQRHAN